MRQSPAILPVIATLLALLLSVPMAGLHGTAHGGDAMQHLHQVTPHLGSPDTTPLGAPEHPHDIACMALCTGPLLTTATPMAQNVTSHRTRHRTEANRRWTDWVRAFSPPPKLAA